MNRIGKFGLLLTGTCLPIVSLISSCDLGSKSEYSILQIVEERERHSDIKDVAFRTVEDYTVAGFPADAGKGNVWILLYPKHSPYYKQIPQLQFTISKAVLNRIQDSRKASETVIAVLETRVTR